MAQRPESLSPAEIELLGYEYAAKIGRIRDHAINYVALRGDVLDLQRNAFFTPHRSRIDFTSIIDYEFPLVDQDSL